MNRTWNKISLDATRVGLGRMTQIGAMVAVVTLLGFQQQSGWASPPTGVVAYVEEIFGGNGQKLTDVATITRAKKEPAGESPKDPADEIYLFPGDTISVKKEAKGVDLYVRLVADGHRLRISYNEPAFTVPNPAIPGVPARVATFLKTFFLGQDFSGNGLAMSGSRGEETSGPCFNASGETNQPRAFDIPALAADETAFAPGNRELVVSWIGGAPPFSVEIARVDTGKVIHKKDGIAGACAVRFPVADYTPGRYRVSVIDANKASMVDQHVSTERAPPRVPAEISGAALPADVKELYAATWLAAVNGRRWAFEAFQRVSALDCRSPAVKEWLRDWGGLLPKCEAKGP